MKVLLIDVNCKYSSTGKIVYDLYTDLNANGHTAAVCYGRGPQIMAPHIYKFSTDVEVYTHALMTRLTGLTGCYSFFATHKLIKFIDEFKPDVVNIHELHAYFVNIAPVVNYLKKNDIKTVWTFHCEFMYTGKCGHAYECEGWKNECGKCPQLKEYPSSWLFDCTKKMIKEKKKLFNGFDNLTIITPSNWLADRVRHSFLKDKDIRVIQNGIDTKDVFYPRPVEQLKEKHHITDERIVLAVAPNLISDQKGGRYVLQLAERLINRKIKFILIGIEDLSEKYEENIIALSRTKNQQELAEYYSMADVTIVTSKRETFSLVCAESLACGTPILGFEAGAPSEVAPNGYGVFVPFGDIDKLEETLKTFIEGSLRLKSLEECAEFGKYSYDKAIMSKKYIDVFAERI